jgi:nicotinate-nucleotide adenylyltransferase
MSKTKEIGLFFGTFNPIHVGHLIVANYMAEYTNLDEVWFVITPHNPHKKKKSLLEDYHRHEMVEMALESYPKLKASTIEFGMPQPNYTVNTMVVLEEKYPNYRFSLIMGADNLKSLHKWKNFEVLLKHYKIFVYPRISNQEITDTLPEFEIEKTETTGIYKVEAPIIELSSTFIRKAIASKKEVRPMLSGKVWEYIDLMNFYKPKAKID